MNWAFVRREWGAVVFVVTVLIGIIVVPTALILNKQQASPANAVLVQTPTPTASPSGAGASASPSGSPTPSGQPGSPSPSPTR